MQRRLFRCIPFLDFKSGSPPRFLFASGLPNRWNPRGVHCLYLSEDEGTADAEYSQAWRGTPREHQPKLTFRAEVDLRRTIDFADPTANEHLELSEGDHEADWLTSSTRTQEIGRAISGQRSISAVRYRSVAAKRLGRSGWNVAIFPDALRAPSRVAILGEGVEPLEVLPAAR